MIVDARARERALDIRTSFCVSAPAGSGKTDLLTQRMLALLADVDQPEAILAMTFTKKAAAEMKNRILEHLTAAKESSSPPNEEHLQQTWQLAHKVLQCDAQKNWRLLDYPNRLQIMTIDSFNRFVAEQLPIKSGLSEKMGIVSDPDILYDQAAREVIAHPDLRIPIETLLREVVDNRSDDLVKMLVKLLPSREQWLPLCGTGGMSGKEVCDELDKARAGMIMQVVEETIENLKPWLDKIFAICAELDCSPLQYPCLPTDDDQRLAALRKIADLLLTQGNGLRKKLTKKQEFLPKKNKTQKDAMLDIIAHIGQAHADIPKSLENVRELPQLKSSENEWRLVEAVTAILPKLAAHLMVIFHNKRQVDYQQIAMGAQDALGRDDCPTDIALQLDYRLHHILIDEFQDTSSHQFQLVRKLTADWAEYNEQYPQSSRTIFVVGDAMQSCYSWRGAMVGLFLHTRRNGIGNVGLELCNLQTNFRTTHTIIEWINHCFADIFPRQENIAFGAVSYTPMQADRQGDTAAPQVHVFVGANNQKKGTAEATWLVKQIKEYQQISPRESIAILVRTRKCLEYILPALRAHKVNWRAEEIDKLAIKMTIGELLALVRAFTNPNDRIAWLALLRAPWCALDHADLLAVAGDGMGETIWHRLCAVRAQSDGLSRDGAVRITALVNILHAAFDRRERVPFSQWILGVWRSLGGPALVAKRNEWQDADQFFALLAQLDDQLPDAVYIEKQIAKLYSSSLAPDANSVHIMTVHTAKGLEFDTVFLPSLHRASHNDSTPLLLWDYQAWEKQSPLLIGAKLPQVQKNKHELLYYFLEKQNKLRREYEEDRLLYIGATRARKRLILSGWATQKEQKLSLTDALGRVCAVTRYEIHEVPSQQQAPEQIAEPTIWRLPLSSLSVPESPSARTSPPQKDSKLPESEWVEYPRVSTAIGNVIHELLKHLAEGVDLPPAARRQEMVESLLRQQGVASQQMNDAVVAVNDAIDKTLADKTGQWILNPAHKQGVAEWALTYYEKGELKRRVIDRYFIDEKGVPWIIDYKSAVPTPTESQERFIAQQVQSHQAQLQEYAQLVFAHHSKQPRIALYFPRVPLFHPL